MKPRKRSGGAAKRISSTQSNRVAALIVAVLGVVALVVAAIVFAGATTSGRVAQNAQSLHWANAMLGEVTPRMAEAITSSRAPKILLPLSQEDITLVCIATEPLPHMVQQAVDVAIKQQLNICGNPSDVPLKQRGKP